MDELPLPEQMESAGDSERQLMTLDPGTGTGAGKRKMSILGNLGGETDGGPDQNFMNKIMGKLHEGVKSRIQREAEENLDRVEEEDDEESDLYKIKEVRDLTECRTSDQFLNLISH